MTQYIKKYAEAAVPRYTSYPSANLFSDVSPLQAGAWIGELNTESPVSLYVHVPFCRQLCWYCGCHTTVTRRYSPIRAYSELLIKEFEIWADHVGAIGSTEIQGKAPSKLAVSHLHFGGGTPNSLEANDMCRIMKKLRSLFSFAVNAEIATEIDPRTLTEEFAEVLALTGFNRVSLGIQDVSRDVQELINRVQTEDQVEAAVTTLRRVGIERINFDLLYGLPGQTVDHVLRSADAAIDHGADRVAVFGYAHVPWFKKHQSVIDKNMLADGPARLKQAQTIAERLQSKGMVAIGLDHFAVRNDPLAKAYVEGTLRRNFQGYTTDSATALLGFGASSISKLPGAYLQNEPHLGRYRQRIESRKLATTRGIGLTEDDRFRAELIEELMCHGAVNLHTVCARHDRTLTELNDAFYRLKELENDDIVHADSGTITMTKTGAPYVRCVAACFDRYFRSGSGKHSSAV